jgi:hypothetical protein
LAVKLVAMVVLLALFRAVPFLISPVRQRIPSDLALSLSLSHTFVSSPAMLTLGAVEIAHLPSYLEETSGLCPAPHRAIYARLTPTSRITTHGRDGGSWRTKGSTS